MLEVKNLTFKVDENGVERSIVQDISFTVEDGEMLVITGPNGGGKSSLAKVLIGIEKADAGQRQMCIRDRLTTGQMQVWDLRFSSRRVSRE